MVGLHALVMGVDEASCLNSLPRARAQAFGPSTIGLRVGHTHDLAECAYFAAPLPIHPLRLTHSSATRTRTCAHCTQCTLHTVPAARPPDGCVHAHHMHTHRLRFSHLDPHTHTHTGAHPQPSTT